MIYLFVQLYFPNFVRNPAQFTCNGLNMYSNELEHTALISRAMNSPHRVHTHPHTDSHFFPGVYILSESDICTAGFPIFPYYPLLDLPARYSVTSSNTFRQGSRARLNWIIQFPTNNTGSEGIQTAASGVWCFQ